MVADGYYPRQSGPGELWIALGWALLLHLGLVVLLVLAGWWKPVPKVVSVAGPVIEAALVVTNADIQRAEQAAAEAPKPEPVPVPEPPQREVVEEAAPPPQPKPEPKPHTSPEPPQTAPQQPLEDPAKVEQERIARLAEEKAEREKQEQEAKRRQEQVDLTESERQEEAERKQRLLAQQRELEAIRKEREAAAKATKLAEEKLKQLADRQPAAAKPAATPTPTPAAPVGGNNGTDTDLEARYVLALNRTAHANWNRSLAPEGVACKATFIQIPGGDVIDVRFGQCPFDAQGRESVERALKKTPMPYAGFESAFKREITLTLCYPQEACPR